MRACHFNCLFFATVCRLCPCRASCKPSGSRACLRQTQRLVFLKYNGTNVFLDVRFSRHAPGALPVPPAVPAGADVGPLPIHAVLSSSVQHSIDHSSGVLSMTFSPLDWSELHRALEAGTPEPEDVRAQGMAGTCLLFVLSHLSHCTLP